MVVVQQIALALGSAGLLALLWMVVILLCVRTRIQRNLKHDLNGSLSLIMMELDRVTEGRSRDALAAKQIVSTIKGYLHPEGKQWVNLRQYLRLIVSSYRHQEIEYYDSAKPTVKVDRIHLEETTIRISNPATAADIAQLLSSEPGSTRGEGRGNGLRSILDSCERIGWGAAWDVSGTRAITTLRFA
ncbi:MAG: hypothetical protein ACYTG7_24170 [Planctomycetota bacterium]|jgi:hypothetical protein